MIEHDWVTVPGQVPSDNEEWRKIPGVPDKYEMSNLRRFRAWYKHEGSILKPHATILKPDKGRILLGGKRYNILLLAQIVFGDSFCDEQDGECWIDVKGFEELYQVSNYGRVRSKSHFFVRKNGIKQFNRERIISFCKINSGYMRVLLHKNGKVKSMLVHRLVAEHFLPNPNSYQEVNHKNENKTDNRVSNLEWCDKLYNSLYGTCQQRRIETRLRNNGGKYGVPRKGIRRSCI